MWRRRKRTEPVRADSTWRQQVEELIVQLNEVVERFERAADRFEKGVRDA